MELKETGQVFVGSKTTPDQEYYSMADVYSKIFLPMKKIRYLMKQGQFPQSFFIPVKKRVKNKKTGRYELINDSGERWHAAEILEWKSKYWGENSVKISVDIEDGV